MARIGTLVCLAVCCVAPALGSVSPAPPALPALSERHRVVGAQGSCDEPPLAIEDVEYYLKNYLPFSRLRQKIDQCGVTFILDVASERRLRGAGATDELVRLLAPPAALKTGEVWRARTDL